MWIVTCTDEFGTAVKLKEGKTKEEAIAGTPLSRGVRQIANLTYEVFNTEKPCCES